MLEQMKVSLQWVNIVFLIQVNSQESREYVHLMAFEIVLSGDPNCLRNVAQASGRCICSLVVNAFDLVISSPD